MCRQQVGAQLRPVVLEGTLQSPKLLAAAHGSNAPETTAAVSALGGAIQQLQRQLSALCMSDRCSVPYLGPASMTQLVHRQSASSTAFICAQLVHRRGAAPTALPQAYAEEMLGPWLL